MVVNIEQRTVRSLELPKTGPARMGFLLDHAQGVGMPTLARSSDFGSVPEGKTTRCWKKVREAVLHEWDQPWNRLRPRTRG